MPRINHPIPRNTDIVLFKADIISELGRIDQDSDSRARVIQIEQGFRTHMGTLFTALPSSSSEFTKFQTSPFVLMAFCKRKGYSRISQIEKDLVPGKIFSSIETSTGKMIEKIVLPIFGWETAPSASHTHNSALDGKRIEPDVVKLATLKSGPRCLNDDMSLKFADKILEHHASWAREAGKPRIDFTYGVLYGTPSISNKKDWHILRHISEKLPPAELTISPSRRWDCAFVKQGIEVAVTVRIGKDWWAYLGQRQSTYLEVCIALIRACVPPAAPTDPQGYGYEISDLASIVSTDSVPPDFAVALLQREQIPWLFFLARHFCDELR